MCEPDAIGCLARRTAQVATDAVRTSSANVQRSVVTLPRARLPAMPKDDLEDVDVRRARDACVCVCVCVCV